jgi:hypothetical protein
MLPTLASNADWGLRKLHDTSSRLDAPTTRTSGRHGILQFLVRSEEVSQLRHFNVLSVPTSYFGSVTRKGYFQRRAHQEARYAS